MDVAVEGGNLYVEVDGPESNPALLLWPPGRCTLRVWDHLVPRLTGRFQTVRIDIRGLGRSSPAANSETQYTLEQYARDACGVLDHLGRQRCHVWSQSWGSRAAIAFCATYPERVVSAALYAANVDPADVPRNAKAPSVPRNSAVEPGLRRNLHRPESSTTGTRMRWPRPRPRPGSTSSRASSTA